MVKLNKITVTSKTIGSGLLGTVYEGKYHRKKYAVKIEKYSEKYKSEYDTETKFAKVVSKNKYFMKIYDRQIINPCTHKQKKPEWFKFINSHLKKKVSILTKSKKCIMTLCEYVEGKNLQHFINKFTLKDYFRLLIELYTAIKFIKSKGYIHGDLHLQNIICKKKIKL
jgi:serine/threonine protein kinase